MVLRLRLESGLGSTTHETLAWDGVSWSTSGGSSCQTKKQESGAGARGTAAPAWEQARWEPPQSAWEKASCRDSFLMRVFLLSPLRQAGSQRTRKGHGIGQLRAVGPDGAARELSREDTHRVEAHSGKQEHNSRRQEGHAGRGRELTVMRETDTQDRKRKDLDSRTERRPW